ncbi:MAG: hypothetical protein KDA80_04190 [Planctomycetaceae bacterium]|nr:hypothetical protein [Planctomycetaceae bacterium]
MEFNYSYQRDSLVNNKSTRTQMSFSPDTLRQPTFFRGNLRQHLAFREAISALHQVVVSDQRFHPKDKSGYKEWAAKQEIIDWAEIAQQRQETKERIDEIRQELDDLRRTREARMGPFRRAQKKYFDYLYQFAKDAWFVLDPVITVHPDEVFFECFSQDESSYGRLSVSYNVFADVGEFACGTTNIDYSESLYNEFQKIRSYKTTSLEIDPSGFEVQTGRDAGHKEVKIDLPDSWVRGFLQVSSAMSLPMVSFQLDPMDIHNICFHLRRRKEIKGPRSLRYQLTPGEPIRVVFDPWGTVLTCSRSIYQADEQQEIRVWGRRRLHILERLIPVAKSFTVQLLGKGMPSFYLADLGDMTFTLGLSGWTTNDWASSANFDLLAPRADVDQLTKVRVFEALQETWYESPDSLAVRLGLDRSVVLGALAAWTQAGRAIWDGHKQVYRVRELARDPLPLDQLRFTNEREEHAMRFVESHQVKIKDTFEDDAGNRVISGTVKTPKQKYVPSLKLDPDERILSAECPCNFHRQNELRMGPCEHILAIRMQFVKQQRPSWLRTMLR